MIEGVVRKELVTHRDERGFFREVIRVTDAFFVDGFGQLSHSLVMAGVLKAWHAHRRQTQWNYVVSGMTAVALHDTRTNSPTFGETMTFLAGSDQAVCYMFRPELPTDTAVCRDRCRSSTSRLAPMTWTTRFAYLMTMPLSVSIGTPTKLAPHDPHVPSQPQIDGISDAYPR